MVEKNTYRMKGLILKICTALVRLQYPKMEKAYLYYIRDNYFSRLNQIQYFFEDYCRKTKYKETDWAGEFQEELTYVLPFAFWHHLNGTLKRTLSCKGTKELYFFSENHEEKYAERDASFMFRSYDFPNMTHSISKSFTKWVRVPFKEKYVNNIFVYDKPILVIANKYNTEWGKPPINFLSIPTLEKIFRRYKDKYQIIYNRPLSNHITLDNSEILSLNEYSWIKENFLDIILLNDLYEKNRSKVNSFNHLQLMVYANCNHFISTHGGTAALASYFGGSNFILSNGGLEAMFREYSTIFPLLSGAQILHATNEDEILKFMSEFY